MDFSSRRALTFDCYGTLIDWESGILRALRPVLDRYGVEIDDDRLLEFYARHEPDAQAGGYRPYREVLGSVVEGIATELGFTASPDETASLAESIPDWNPFPDTVEALRALKRRFKLGIISNIDDDLFAASARRLEVDFDWVITAEQVGSYKPSTRNFERAIERIGLPGDVIVHVAQSLFHDVVPAKKLGLATVWVNRGGARPGFGATPAAVARPDLEVPDLAALVTAAGID
ncbi:MAG: haloacid dehalogenase type II [Acidobacteriota bacterium]|nr:haloacid dehalogenase type II [Acidobacteriota bacterium]